MSPGQDPGQNNQCLRQQIIVGKSGLSALGLVCRSGSAVRYDPDVVR